MYMFIQHTSYSFLLKEIPILYIAVFDVDNLLGYDTNAYQLIQHVVVACFYLNFSHTNVNGLATPLLIQVPISTV